MSGVAPVSAWLVYLPGVTAVRTAKDLQGSQVKRQVRMCLARADVVDVQCDPVVLRPAAELTPFVIRGQRIVSDTGLLPYVEELAAGNELAVPSAKADKGQSEAARAPQYRAE